MNKQKRRTSMDISSYFLTLEYVLMASTFVAIVLIFLYSYFGKEEEQTNERG
jgi:uncharacterized membrane protein (DUF106 family)